MTRGRQLQALAKSGKVYVPDSDSWSEWLAEMVAFPSGGHDDYCDASFWASILAIRNGAPRDPSKDRGIKQKVHDIYDRLFKKFDESTADDHYMSS
jgi:hypothetical protein